MVWSRLAILAVLAGVLLPWAYYECNVEALNHDIFWLLTGVGRILDGYSMTDAVYETNPPLSLLLYAPAYLLSAATGMIYEDSIFLYTVAVLGFFSLGLYRLVRAWPIWGRDGALGFVCLYILACTVFTVPDFGQRDHFIAMGLVPFVLAQYGLLRGFNLGEKRGERVLRAAIFFAGAVLILLKPHYGLIPTLMLGWRAVSGRGWRVIRDGDFLSLALATVLYAAVIWAFFPDFMTRILPESYSLYVVHGAGTNWPWLAMIAMINLLVLSMTCLAVVPDEIRRFVRVLVPVSLLCLIPCVVMGQGFHYHLLPAGIFMMLGLGLVILQVAHSSLPFGKESGWAVPMALPVFAFVLLLYPHAYYPTQKEVRSAPLAAELAACGPGCDVMVLGLNIRMTQLSLHYAGGEAGMRFTNLWFFPALLALEKSGLVPPPVLARHQEYYAKMLADDLLRWKPQRLVACNEQVDYLAYFSSSPAFAAALRGYHFLRPLSFNQAEFLNEEAASPVSCDIYARNP